MAATPVVEHGNPAADPYSPKLTVMRVYRHADDGQARYPTGNRATSAPAPSSCRRLRAGRRARRGGGGHGGRVQPAAGRSSSSTRRPAVSRYPDDLPIDAALEVPAAAMLSRESVQVGQKAHRREPTPRRRRPRPATWPRPKKPRGWNIAPSDSDLEDLVALMLRRTLRRFGRQPIAPVRSTPAEPAHLPNTTS
jgi:hypothetical protein